MDEQPVHIIQPRYYGLADRSPNIRLNPNPFDDPNMDRHTYIGCCKTCGKTEEVLPSASRGLPTRGTAGMRIDRLNDVVVQRMSSCPTCLTKYCCQACQKADHLHKMKCYAFAKAKTVCMDNLCPKCSKSKWAYMTDPDHHATYTPCRKCRKIENGMEVILRKEAGNAVVDDLDIRRVWIS